MDVRPIGTASVKWPNNNQRSKFSGDLWWNEDEAASLQYQPIVTSVNRKETLSQDGRPLTTANLNEFLLLLVTQKMPLDHKFDR